MSIRSSRRKRRPKPPPPPRTHVCIMTIDIPREYNNDASIDWVQKVFDDYQDKNDCIPTTCHIQETVYKKFGSHDISKAYFSIELTDKEAMAWVSSESMNASLEYRNDKQNTCSSNIYRECKPNGKWYCSICLECNRKHVVSVNNCGCKYHEKCLIEAYKYSRRCPLCNEIMDFEDIYEAVVEIIV